MVQAQSEPGHRTVSVTFDLDLGPRGQQFPCHGRPDEGHADHRQQGGYPLGAGESRVLQVEAPGLQRGMQIFRLPTLRVSSKVRSHVSPVREVQRLPGGILRGGDSQGHAVDQGLAPPDPDFAHLEVLEDRPDGEAVLPDGGTCRKSNAGGNAVLIKALEPVSPDKLSVCEEAPDWLLSARQARLETKWSPTESEPNPWTCLHDVAYGFWQLNADRLPSCD